MLGESTIRHQNQVAQHTTPIPARCDHAMASAVRVLQLCFNLEALRVNPAQTYRGGGGVMRGGGGRARVQEEEEEEQRVLLSEEMQKIIQMMQQLQAWAVAGPNLNCDCNEKNELHLDQLKNHAAIERANTASIPVSWIKEAYESAFEFYVTKYGSELRTPPLSIDAEQSAKLPQPMLPKHRLVFGLQNEAGIECNTFLVPLPISTDPEVVKVSLTQTFTRVFEQARKDGLEPQQWTFEKYIEPHGVVAPYDLNMDHMRPLVFKDLQPAAASPGDASSSAAGGDQSMLVPDDSTGDYTQPETKRTDLEKFGHGMWCRVITVYFAEGQTLEMQPGWNQFEEAWISSNTKKPKNNPWENAGSKAGAIEIGNAPDLCQICFTSDHPWLYNKKCTHRVCSDCAPRLTKCPFCRAGVIWTPNEHESNTFIELE